MNHVDDDSTAPPSLDVAHTRERPDQHNAFSATAVEGRMDCHVAKFTAIIHERS